MPYEPRPNLKILLSREPYLIGLENESYDHIRDALNKRSLQVYDLDEKEFIKSNTSSTIPKRKEGHSYTKQIHDVFEIFFQRHGNYSKNMDSVEETKDSMILRNNYQKVKTHEEFLEQFEKTKSYNIIKDHVNQAKSRREGASDLSNVVNNILQNRWRVTHNSDDQVVEYIVEGPEETSAQILKQKYNDLGVIVPISIILDDQDVEIYRYKFFPKLLDELMLSIKYTEKIKWPAYPTDIVYEVPARDIFRPPVAYNKNNINLLIWII